VKTAIMWESSDGTWRVRRDGPESPVGFDVFGQSYFKFGSLEKAGSREEAEFRLLVDGYALSHMAPANSCRVPVYVFLKEGS